MKLKVPQFVKTTQENMSKHSPEILTAVGIVGMVTTVVLAVKATPKALESIDKEINRKNKEIVDEAKKNGETKCSQISKLDPVETVKVAWKPYIPAAITGVVSIGCIIGANSVNAKRNAALAATAQLTASTLAEYKKQVDETVDEETKKIINEKVTKEKLKKNPINDQTVREPEIIMEHGNHLCYDAGGNQYFRSDEQTIRAAINRLNNRMNGGEPYVSLNDLYSELGVKGTHIGELLGWNVYRDGIIEPVFDSHIASSGEPCIVISYLVSPAYDYHKIEY